MNGYCGKLLKVDLGSGTASGVSLPAEAARDYIGGSALAARLFFEEMASVWEAGRTGHPGPLDPDNPLIIMTGPLTSLRLPAAARWTVSARSRPTRAASSGPSSSWPATTVSSSPARPPSRSTWS